VTPSHLLKLERANHHRREMEDLLRDLRDRREYPVLESSAPERTGLVWTYKVDLASARSDERFPIVVSDYLFTPGRPWIT
jgi:hypothetical protein